MSLVAYGSSDESSDEDETSENVNNVKSLIKQTRTLLSLPAPKDPADHISNSQPITESNVINTTKHSTSSTTDEFTLFKNLPKPKHSEIDNADEKEDDIIIPHEKDTRISAQEKGAKKNRAPVKISLPSLSEFKDVDEEQEERRKNRIKPSQKGTGLFSILPPPKGSSTKATIKSLIPDVLKKVLQPTRPVQSKQVKITPGKTANTIKKSDTLASMNYDSDSDEETSGVGGTNRKVEGKVDFFSLESTGSEVSSNIENSAKDFFSLQEKPQTISAKSSMIDNSMEIFRSKRDENVSQTLSITDEKIGYENEKTGFSTTTEYLDDGRGAEIINKTLTSNVINLPKEDIIMKNKAEVGPKLPIPEQEYNVDSQGNVAFDEKAIEYLCGKRGVKRKNKDFDEANIIEINGEDIKPDEREWLVKALTEEAAERPVSMESAGPSTQSRKKHQITYLAHQAKAMEVELKNQWAQNRVTRKQTQSKYGF